MLIYHSTRVNARKHSLKMVRCISEVQLNGRLYRLLDVETQGVAYRCLRLYNASGHFIKQFLFEPELSDWLKTALEDGDET